VKRCSYIVATLCLLATPAFAQVAMPDPQLTPGATRPLTTKQVCTIKWGRDERHLSQSTKKQVCVAYGITSGCPGPKWELDHSKSRELAGSDDRKNIWPQPIKEARMKDRLENLLHKKVCAGEISLPEAQREIGGSNWYVYYKKYFPEKAAK